MYKNFYLKISILFLLITATSCVFIGRGITGSGNVKEEVRKTGDFDKIEVSRGIEVLIKQGTKTKVVVKADENLLDIIETEVEDGTLKISAKENIRRAASKKVLVTTPGISMVTTSSGGEVVSKGMIKVKELELSAGSGSNIKFEINVAGLEAGASSGSDIVLQGLAKNATLKASSGANIKAHKLKTKNCKASVSSGADIDILVKKHFEGHASSGGDIRYFGNPETKDISKSSGGDVSAR